MSFTQDELQALNAIFDQKMVVLQHELEHSINQHMQILKQEFEQHVKTIVSEQLINQRLSLPVAELPVPYTNEAQADLQAIEVQTDIAWEDLIEMIDKALMERLTALNASLQSRMQEMERALTTRMHQWRNTPQHTQPFFPREHSAESLANMQDVFASIEQLEHLIESMQLAMMNNSALLANRLYHHQQLPVERAHPGHQENSASLHPSDNKNVPISLPEDI